MKPAIDINAHQSDGLHGWKLVQKSLHRILEYSRSEGILQGQEHEHVFNMTGV